MGETSSFDIIFRNGSILDGSGGEPYQAEIGICGQRIAAIGDLKEMDASIIIDASGLRICPGFIDIHTHSDISVLFNPQMESMVSQGVTTQVTGNCGLCLGLAVDDKRFFFEQRWMRNYGVRISWNSVGGHLKRVEESGVATNYIMLAGQGALRKRVMGQENRPPDRAEMEKMKSILASAMEDGAWGISTGLEYTPSSYADVNELAEISKVLEKYGGIYATHLRNEGDHLEEAVEEALEIGRRAGIPVQLSHHKAEGRRNWGKVHRTLEMVREARLQGADVQMDQYPYTAFQTSLSVQFLPIWANVGDNDTVLERLTSNTTRQKILDDIRKNHPDWDDLGPESIWNGVEIAMSRTNRELQGKTIAELAKEIDANPIEYTLDMIAKEKNFISAINFAICEEDIEYVMQFPFTMIGSDAVGCSPHGKMSEDHVHPRCYGTFPRVLGRYVREKATIQEADAIRKMTSLPARRLGMKERGELKKGYFADIVMYSPQTISDRATFHQPHQFSTGIEVTMVNGQIVWQGGAHTARLPGMVLRKSS
jgi:N-acyl-D-amino-acid deacylase